MSLFWRWIQKDDQDDAGGDIECGRWRFLCLSRNLSNFGHRPTAPLQRFWKNFNFLICQLVGELKTSKELGMLSHVCLYCRVIAHARFSLIKLPSPILKRAGNLTSLFIGVHKGKQARKLQATLVGNYHRLADSLTVVKCRATSVAKNDRKSSRGTLRRKTHLFEPYLSISINQHQSASINLNQHQSASINMSQNQ